MYKRQGSGALFVNEGKAEIKSVCNRGCSLGSTGVWTDDHTVLDIEVLANPAEGRWLSVKVVDWYVEEALDLTGMEIHRDYMVAASGLKHVRHEFGRDWSARLVFLVLTSVWEVGQDGGDSTGRGSFAGIDHNEEFHNTVVDVARSGRLEDKDIFVTDRLSDGHRGFLVRVLKDHNLAELNSETALVSKASFTFRGRTEHTGEQPGQPRKGDCFQSIT